MVRFTTLSLLLLLLGRPAAAAPPDEIQDDGYSMMWSVAKKKAPPSSPKVWLLGSIHIGIRAMYPLPPTVEAAFQDAEVLAVELDAVHLDKQAVAPLLMKYAASNGGKPWTERVDPALLETVRRVTGPLGIPQADLASLDPWFLAFLQTQGGLQDLRSDLVDGTDAHLLQRVGTREIREIEGLAAQLGFMDRLPFDAQIEMLREAGSQNEAATFDTLVRAWIAGDIGTLEKVALGSATTPAGRKLRRLLFSQRNKGMARFVEDAARGPGDVLVVVGAGHLLGKDGVVALLRKKGYEVLRIKRNP
jgi:uncharacterized protein YbaP (TraB family)